MRIYECEWKEEKEEEEKGRKVVRGERSKVVGDFV